MRVAILGERGGWHIARLGEALERRGHATDVVSWRSIGAAIGPGLPFVAPPQLATADVVVVRGMPGVGAAGIRLEDVIFRMDALAEGAARRTPVINPPRALEIAIDKYLSLALLARAGVPVPRTIIAPDADAAREAWVTLGGDCVTKPLFGSRGRGIVRVRDAEAAAASGAAGTVYLQEFVPNGGWDLRVLVAGDETFAMRRVAAAGEWRTNVSLGGRPEPVDLPAAVVDLARRAAACVGAVIAGVDLLPTRDGFVVLEVNGVPAWRGLQTVTATDLSATVASVIERASGRPAAP
ncbi:MAG: RimK family alpha-L-glutamate ligase [Planctomycetaceae bacterium]